MGSAHYRVEWTEEAESDALRIVGRFDSRINAERAIAKFDRKAASLAMFPMRGRSVPELGRIGVVKFREVHLGPWRMQYEIRGQVVFIAAIFDGRRDLADILFDRLIRP